MGADGKYNKTNLSIIMNPKVQKKSNLKKIDNKSFDAIRDFEAFNASYGIDFQKGLLNFTSVLNDRDWNFPREIHPSFHPLGLSTVRQVGDKNVSRYQIFCLAKLSSILYDAKVLYENNLIDFQELYSIAFRVKIDTYKRFKSIEKSATKKRLQDQKLDENSLVILQAKLALLENEN